MLGEKLFRKSMQLIEIYYFKKSAFFKEYNLKNFYFEID